MRKSWREMRACADIHMHMIYVCVYVHMREIYVHMYICVSEMEKYA